MYTGKSCTEFNILAGIPPCSEYPLGDCAGCRLQTSAILTLKLGAHTACGAVACAECAHQVSSAESHFPGTGSLRSPQKVIHVKHTVYELTDR